MSYDRLRPNYKPMYLEGPLREVAKQMNVAVHISGPARQQCLPAVELFDHNVATRPSIGTFKSCRDALNFLRGEPNA